MHFRAAFWDRHLQDDRWRLLDIGRKELLLPLHDADLIREGAAHVTSMHLSQRATRLYVQGVLQARLGKGAQSRVTPGRAASGLKRLREGLTKPAVRRSIRDFTRRYDDDACEAFVAELDAMIATLREIKRDVGKR